MLALSSSITYFLVKSFLSDDFLPFVRQLNSPILRTTKDALLKVLEEALTNLYGIVGGALLIDLIDFKVETGIATLRCRKRSVLFSLFLNLNIEHLRHVL